MIVISSETELLEYAGYAKFMEYKIKSCHKYLTIPVWIKTRGMKLPFSIYGTNIVVLKICVIDWQSYPSLCDTLFFFGIFDDMSLWILPETHDPSLYDTPNEILTVKKMF